MIRTNALRRNVTTAVSVQRTKCPGVKQTLHFRCGGMVCLLEGLAEAATLGLNEPAAEIKGEGKGKKHKHWCLLDKVKATATIVLHRCR